MPENLNDTPARLEENVTYMQDPQHPRGKPYSRKQQSANEGNKGRTYLYNQDNPTEGQVFQGDEVDQALGEGWKDEPLVHPNCPDKGVDKAWSAPKQDAELKVLWDEIDRLGIKPRPHHKSGKDKLMKAITDYG